MSNSSVLRKESKDRYSTIDLEAMDNDDRLSFKEAGILYYLLTRPDGWEFNRQDLINRKSDGRTAIKNGLSNLKEYGYLEIDSVQKDDGKFDGYVWHITPDPEELPLPGSTDTEPRETRCSDKTPHNNKQVKQHNNVNTIDSNESIQSKEEGGEDSDSLPDSFKEQQGWIIDRLSPHVGNTDKLWGLTGKWINDYGFYDVASVIRALDNKGKLDIDNLIGYIVSILESDKSEQDVKDSEWEQLTNDLD